jgi:hypothetical protein
MAPRLHVPQLVEDLFRDNVDAVKVCFVRVNLSPGKLGENVLILYDPPRQLISYDQQCTVLLDRDWLKVFELVNGKVEMTDRSIR